MTRHAELAELSSYLDGELPGGRRRELEEHVRSCARCRGRLTGLERTVARLREVGRERPPNELAGRVHHRLALEHHRPSRLQAIEQWLAQWRPAPALIAGAAVVVALAAIVQIYISGGAAVGERDTATDTPAPQATPSPRQPRAVEESIHQELESLGTAADATRRMEDSPRNERRAPDADAEGEPPPARALAGHRFQLHEGAWVEEGAVGSPPDRELTWDQAEAEGILDASPHLTRFRDSDRPIVMRYGDRVIRIVPGR